MNLNQVTLESSNIGRSVAFYRRLGLELFVLSDHYARLLCPGGATFSVHLAETPSCGGALIYFECEDLDARCERLTAEGVVFDSPPTDQRWLWREARLSDPDGNRLCLYWAGENRVNPPWRVVTES
jgi:catechol 2,3-dioxygenase-like lactoylglutathione lyase family enzyme